MAPFPWDSLAYLIALIVLNGIFAMSELAIVSARTSKLRQSADEGSASARTAMRLAAEPGKFLSTVQIGITLVGIINGAVSGAALGGPVGERLVLLGVDPESAPEIGFAVVIGLTTYFSLIIGELVPKQIALRSPEPIAIVMARPMDILARVAAPFVWLLDNSSNLLLRLMRVRHRGEQTITAQELQMIFADATRSGVIEEGERAILSGVMRLANRPVRELMTPRTELEWIDVNASEDEIRARIAQTSHSLLPVAEGTPDDKVLGVIKVREVLALIAGGKPVVLAQLVRKSEVVPDQLDAIDAMRALQQSGTAMALVHDEYGHLDGVVTSADLLAAIAGDFASHQDEGDSPLVAEREDGSLLISGALAADALAERLGIDLPEQRDFATAAGYVLDVLKYLPTEGEHFTQQGWRFEVVDLDGRRIDKLLVSKVGRSA